MNSAYAGKETSKRKVFYQRTSNVGNHFGFWQDFPVANIFIFESKNRVREIVIISQCEHVLSYKK